MSTGELAPDRDALAQFVAVMFKHASPKGYVSLRAFPDRGSKNRKAIFLDPIVFGSPDLLGTTYERVRQAANWREPAVFCPPLATFKTPENAKTENILEGIALSVECDATPRAALTQLEQLIGKPTIVVESGGEWKCPETGEIQPKLHIHWRLRRPSQTLDEHASLREARQVATDLVGADGTNKAIVHPIRWPGSWHRKKSPPRLARIAWSSESDIDLQEALAALRDAAGMIGTEHKANGKHRAADDAYAISALAVIPNSDLAWDDWNRVGMATWAATGGSDAGRDAFAAWSAKSKKNDPEATINRWNHYRTYRTMQPDDSLRSAPTTGKAGWPADRVERWPIERLFPYARNARTHSDAQVDQIAASIREWGWTNPVLVGEDGTIIAGHGRVLGARKLGLGEVPVMVATGWSEAQKKAYAIADNKLSLNAGWDDELLGLELGELEVLGFDMDLIGFTEAERIALLAQGNEGLTDPDDVPELPKEPVARSGDVWLLGRHRLLCGDSTCLKDVERVLAGVSPHLMVTDPPYGVNYDPAWRKRAGVNLNEGKLGKVANDDRSDWREAWALFPGTVAYVWHAGRYTSEVQQSLEATGFEPRAQIIWGKDRFALSRGHYHWQHEPCWYAVRGSGSHWSGDRKQSTLWTINAREDDGHGHGTQKPVECMRRPIENNSSPGQAVYEPFSGSGTTIIAAEMTGRSCFAIELDPAYVDVSVLRWQAFTGQSATLEKDGRAFAEVSAERRPEKAD